MFLLSAYFSFLIAFVVRTCSMQNIEKINSKVKKNQPKIDYFSYVDLLIGRYSIQNISKENDPK